MGRAVVGAPVPLASLSKAITGVCIANLIDRGRLSFDITAVAGAGAHLRPHSALPPIRVCGRYDQQCSSSRRFRRQGGLRPRWPTTCDQYRAPAAFDTQLKWLLPPAGSPRRPGTRNTYSNAGYMVLGAVIEEASGQDYEG